MTETHDLAIIGGTVVNQDGVGIRDIGISGGRIAEIGTVDRSVAGTVIDAGGLTILPGVIDTQVHFREPGAEHKEDLESGSRSAVIGGVTAVFEMPNTNPLTIDAARLEDKLARAKGRMHCDHAFWVGGTHDNVNEIAALERLPGAAGVKVFMGSSTGDLLIADDPGVGAILSQISRRAAFHAEDESRLVERLGERIEGDPQSHAVWRDHDAALQATQRLVALARTAGKPVHVLHVSTAEEMAFLADHKDIASVEVTPHHLTLSADDYATLGGRIVMNPPIRAGRHCEALWRALRSGVADILGSDHAPHTREEKDRPYPASPSGMPGVQTLVPIMLNHVAAGRMTLQRFCDMTSAGPARLFGIARKGRIAVGYDADLTIVDLGRRTEITDSWMVSRGGWTPYNGREVTGWPVGTIIRGHRVMWEGELLAGGCGQPVRFHASLGADNRH